MIAFGSGIVGVAVGTAMISVCVTVNFTTIKIIQIDVGPTSFAGQNTALFDVFARFIIAIDIYIRVIITIFFVIGAGCCMYG